jgi:hypothetical protein
MIEKKNYLVEKCVSPILPAQPHVGDFILSEKTNGNAAVI